jgi:hypothetical protein
LKSVGWIWAETVLISGKTTDGLNITYNDCISETPSFKLSLIHLI